MYQDLGLRIVILGASEARRNIGMVRGDLNLLESTIRKVSGTTAVLGQNLTRLGSAMSAVGRTMTVSITTPLVAMQGALIGAGIGFEDAFAGVGKTVDGVSNGFKEIVQMTPDLNQEVIDFMNKMNALGGPAQQMTWDEAFNALLLTMPDVTKNAILADKRFGELTFTGKRLREEFIGLSLEIPFSASALADIGRVAGQMGVPASQLIEFTKVVAELGIATNISGEDAAFAIARTANIFGVSGDQMGKFALQFSSALVDLGNSTAATESEILNVSTRMSAVGRLAGMSVPEILGWGASMAEMGVRSELGGTAFSRVIYEMLDAVNAGGDGLKQYADVAGMSADKFAETFRANPTQALGTFLSKLVELEKAGKIDQDTLTAMGFEGIRVKQVMDLLGPNMELVTTNVNKANVAWQQQIALQQEAQKKFATTKAKIMLVRNAFTAMGIAVFDLYKNKIDNFLDRLQKLFITFKKLSPSTQRWIVTLGLLAAAAGPVLVVLGTILQSAGTVITAFSAIPSVIGGVISSFIGLLPVLLPIAAVAGIIYLAWSKNFAGIRTVVHKVADDFKWFKTLFIDDIVADLKRGDFTGAFEGLKFAFNASLDWFNKTGIPLFIGMFSNAKDEISTILDEVKTAVEQKLGNAGAYLEGNLPTLFKGITDTAQGFKDFFSAFEGTKTSGFNEVWKTLLVFLGAIASIVGAGLSAFAPVLKPLGEDLSKLVTAVSNWLEAEKPSEKLIQFFNDLGPAVQNLPDTLKNLGTQFLSLKDAIVNQLSTTNWPDVGKNILDKMATKAEDILAWTQTNILFPIGDALINFDWSVISGVGKNILGKIIVANIEFYSWAVDKFIKPLIQEIYNAIDIPDIAKTLGLVTGKILKLMVVGPIDLGKWVMDNLIKPLFGQGEGSGELQNALQGKEAQTGGEAAGKSILEKIKAGFANIAGWVLDNVIVPFLSGLIEGLGDKNTEAQLGLFASMLLDGIGNGLSNIKTWVQDKIINPITTELQTLPSSITTALSGLGTAIENALFKPFDMWVNKVNGVINTILGPIDAIKKALGLDTTTTEVITTPAGTPPTGNVNPSGHQAGGGMFKGWSWVGEKGPEIIYSPDKLGVISNSVSKAIASLSNPPAPSVMNNNSKSSVYSPVFNAAPTSEVLRSNHSLYEEWLLSSQGF